MNSVPTKQSMGLFPIQSLVLEHLTAALLFIISALVNICHGLMQCKSSEIERSGYRKAVR